MINLLTMIRDLQHVTRNCPAQPADNSITTGSGDETCEGVLKMVKLALAALYNSRGANQ